MVGGRIRSVSRKDGIATITVQGTGCEKNDALKAKTEFRGDIPTGGQIWWQSRHLFVRAPEAKAEQDIGRVGYSYR